MARSFSFALFARIRMIGGPTKILFVKNLEIRKVVINVRDVIARELLAVPYANI